MRKEQIASCEHAVSLEVSSWGVTVLVITRKCSSLLAECVVSCNMVSYLLNSMLKHQGLDGQQFSLGPKGERLKFQTSMPSRQLAALGLKVKDSNSKKMNVLIWYPC